MAQRPSTSEITPAPPSSELTQDRPVRPYYVRPRVPSVRQGQEVIRGNEEPGFSLGWLCFFAGFICMAPWLLGFIISFVSENKNDKRARYWNLVAFLIVAAVYVVVYTSYDE